MISSENIETVCKAVRLLQENGFDVHNVEFNSGIGIRLDIEKTLLQKDSNQD